MRVKSKNFFKIAFTLCCVLLLSSSCEKKEYYDNYYNDTDVWVDFITIKKSDWKWNDVNSRYEVIKYLDVSQKYYDDSVINASVFLHDGDVEVQTPLPYLRTWYEGNITYSETLSYDVSFQDQTIAFYIQSSDLIRDDSVLPNSYQIKYSFIYQESK